MEKQKILIIDSDREYARKQQWALEQSGLEAYVLYEAEKGLSFALKEDIRLVFVGAKVGKVNGTTICKKIKEEKKIPVIISGTEYEEMEVVSAICMGANDYFVRPYNENIMVAKVKALLELYDDLLGNSARKVDMLQVGHITINKALRMVSVDNVEKNFTSKEYELLVFLAEHPNKVFSKEELFREIWDMDSVGDIATVTVHIKKLREKIEKDPSKPKHIETIWGVGYRYKV